MEFHVFLARSAAIFFAILAGMFGGPHLSSQPASPIAQASSTATSTLSVLPSGTGFFIPSFPGLSSTAHPGIVFPFSFPQLTQTTSSPSNNYSVVPPAVIAPPVPKTPVPVAPVVSPTTPPAFTDAGTAEVAKSIVNILCTSKKTGVHSISGSGSIVDPRGIIVTAAHVGQYFLLEKASDGADMSCVIRMGDPAKTLYKATPIYVSQKWVSDNSEAITESMATGNGKNDYAFLAIVASATGGSLPASFPSLTLSSVPPRQGDPIIIGTYGAEFLTNDQIRDALSPTIIETTIQKVYTLQVTPTDLLSLGASDAAQAGSSGGVVVDAGKVVGVVTTSSLGADRSTRDLRAVSMGLIRKSYENETGGSLDLDLQASIASLIERFSGTEEGLADILDRAIDAAN